MQTAASLIGLLGIVFSAVLPIIVWRRPPMYRWVCPSCKYDRNLLGRLQCEGCERRMLESDQREHLRARWRARDLLAIYCVSLAASMAGALLILGALNKLPPENAPPAEIVRFFMRPEPIWTTFAFSNASLLLFAVTVAGSRFRWSIRDLGLCIQGQVRSAFIGAAAGAVLFLLSMLFSMAVGYEGDDIFPFELKDPLWTLIVLNLVALTPLTGELFFRGMLYRMLRRRRSIGAAAFISAALYSIVLGAPALFTFAALGILNAALFERYKSLTPGTAAAAIFGACLIALSAASGIQLI